MSNPDIEGSADLAFERLLLDSASEDEPNRRAIRAAFERFSALSAGTAVLGAAAASGPTALHGKWIAAKWLLIGALGGSTVTAVWMHRHPAGPASSPSRGGATEVPLSTPKENPAPAALTAPLVPRMEGAGHATEAPKTGHPRSGKPDPRRALEKPPLDPGRAALQAAQAGRSSTLSAEVSLVDAARTAIGMGSYGEALRLVDEYHRDFPAGELEADAEVVAIDALAGRGEQSAVRERAARFLSRYPNDPHAARVRLVGE